MRSGPTRFSAHGMSDVACVGCMEAMTPQLREAWEVLGSEYLRMLDAQPRATGAGHFLFGLFVSVQHAAICRIADGVGANLKAGLQRAARQAVNVSFRGGHQAFRLRRIAVRFEKRCTARAERAIRKKLERANRQLVVRIDFRPALEPFVNRAVQHGVNAQPSRTNSRNACAMIGVTLASWTEVSPVRRHSRAASCMARFAC